MNRWLYALMAVLLLNAGCGGSCGSGRAACGYPTTAAPTIAQQYPAGEGLDVDVAGNLVFLVGKASAGIQIHQRAADGEHGLLKRGHAALSGNAVAGTANMAFVATNEEDAALLVLDLRDLDDPVAVGAYRTPSQQPGSAVFAAPSAVYLGTPRNPSGAELFVLNVSDPRTPRSMTSLEIDADVTEIHVEETIAYIGSHEGLHIVDVGTPSRAREVAFLPLGAVTGLDVNHGRALLTTAGTDDNFFVVDVRMPAAPKVVHSEKLDGITTDLEAYFDTAYIASESAIYIFDTTSRPDVIGSVNASITALDVSHGTLYAVSEQAPSLIVLNPGIVSGQAIRDYNGNGKIEISHLGDSNTQLGWQELTTWSEALQQQYVNAGLDWQIDATQAIGGATVNDFQIVLEARPLAAWSQLERTLESSTPDAFVFAFVTNDVVFWKLGNLPEKTAGSLMAAYKTHQETIAAVNEDIPVFITTSPPVRLYNAQSWHLQGGKARDLGFSLSAANDAIFEQYPTYQIIDNYAPLNAKQDLVADGIHLSQQGHNKRADLVFEKLTLGR